MKQIVAQIGLKSSASSADILENGNTPRPSWCLQAPYHLPLGDGCRTTSPSRATVLHLRLPTDQRMQHCTSGWETGRSHRSAPGAEGRSPPVAGRRGIRGASAPPSSFCPEAAAATLVCFLPLSLAFEPSGTKLHPSFSFLNSFVEI